MAIDNQLKVIIGSIIVVMAVFGGVGVKWAFDKDWAYLYRDGDLIAKEKWVVSAERTYFNLDSWYNIHIKCVSVESMGGYRTATRCYYPDNYYQALSRSLINTKVEFFNRTPEYSIVKKSPNYMYGTTGAYAGYVIEEMTFNKDVEKVEEFPEKYTINWSPKDTRNYKLEWRLENLKINKQGTGTITYFKNMPCTYEFGNVKINLNDECNKLEMVSISYSDGKASFFFNNQRGNQFLDIGFVDPEPFNITLISPPNGAVLNSTSLLFNFTISDNNIENCTLFGDWSGTWQANQSYNEWTNTQNISVASPIAGIEVVGNQFWYVKDQSAGQVYNYWLNGTQISFNTIKANPFGITTNLSASSSETPTDWWIGYGSSMIYHYNSTWANINNVSTNLSSVYGLTYYGGNFYVTDSVTTSIYRVNASTGNHTGTYTVSGTPASSAFIGIDTEDGQTFYIATYTGGKIIRTNLSTTLEVYPPTWSGTEGAAYVNSTIIFGTIRSPQKVGYIRINVPSNSIHNFNQTITNLHQGTYHWNVRCLGYNGSTAWASSNYSFSTDLLYLYLNSVRGNQNYEYRTTTNLIANYSGYNYSICIDIGELTNYSCGNGSVSVNYLITENKIITFNDSSSSKSINAPNGNAYVSLDVNAQVDTATFNITGSNVTSTTTTFNDGNSSGNISLEVGEIKYITVPSSGIITASIDLKGDINSSTIYFTYVPTTFNLTDGRNEEVSFVANDTYYFVVCLQNSSGVDIQASCKNYTSGNYTVGDEMRTEVFDKGNLTVGTNYRLKLKWMRTAFNLSGTIQYDHGGSTTSTVYNDCWARGCGDTGFSLCSVDIQHYEYFDTSSCVGLSTTMNCQNNERGPIYDAASCGGNILNLGTSGGGCTQTFGMQQTNCRNYENNILGGTNATFSSCTAISTRKDADDSCNCKSVSNRWVAKGCTDGTNPCPTVFTYAGDYEDYSGYFNYSAFGTDNVALTFDTKLNSSGSISWDIPYIKIDSGNDGGIDYQNNSLWDANETVDLNVTAINNWVDANCFTGACDVPIAINSTKGILVYWNINVTHSGYPTDIEIDANQDGVTDILLRGELRGGYLSQDYFFYDTNKYTTLNISRSTAGTEVIYLNMTTDVDSASHINNLTFQISGYDLDAQNSYLFTEEFNDSVRLDLVNSTFYDVPWWTWDDFYTDTRTTLYKSAGTGTITVDTSDQRVEASISSSCTGSGCTDSDSQKWCTTGLNLSQYKQIEFTWSTSTSAGCDSYDSSNGASANFDLTSSSICSNGAGLPSAGSAAGAGCYAGRPHDHNSDADSGTYTLVRVEDVGSSTYTYKVYSGSSYLGTTSALSGNINFKYSASTSSWTNDGNGYGTASSTFDTIRFSAVSGNYTVNLTYTNNFTIMSKEMYTAPTNIQRATLTARSYMPTGCVAEYYLSNDNGTTWEKIISGTGHAFTSSGKALKWFANVTGCPTSDTGAIIAVSLQIIPQSVTGITIDVGNDGTTDWNTSIVLNSTNSPQNVTIASGSPIYNAIQLICASSLTCYVPISVEYSTPGMIEFKNFNHTLNPNPVNLTSRRSSIESFNPIDLAFSFTNGILEVFGLNLLFVGNHNITVVGHEESNYALNDTHLILVKYSPFNVTIIPPNIDYWDVGPNIYTWIQSNIPPYGNTNGNGNPFFAVKKLIWDHPVDVYVRYNESINSCATTWFNSLNQTTNNWSNITLNTTSKLLVSNITVNNLDVNISTWTNISCAAQNSSLITPYFCFNSLCSECVRTSDWDSDCSLVQ